MFQTCVTYLTEFMIETLKGTVSLSKRLRRHAVWSRPDYGWAWVDLLLLANDRARTVLVNNQSVDLLRGQLAWSLRSLEKEWEKSGEWISAFIKFCRDQQMIKIETRSHRITVITVVNYEVYNPTKPDAETVSDTDTNTGADTEQKGEVGRGSKKGEADSPHPYPESGIPTIKEVGEFCDKWPGDPARGIPATIPECWWCDTLAFLMKGGPQVFPRDWKTVLVLKLRGDFSNRHPKLALSEGKWAGGILKKNTAAAGLRRERGEILQELSLAKKMKKNGEVAELEMELKNS